MSNSNLDISYKQLIDFLHKNSIEHKTIEQIESSYKVRFKVYIKSYVSESHIADNFEFVLSVNQDSDEFKYFVVTTDESEIPFHPHFEIQRKSFISSLKIAIWKDYMNSTEDVVTFLKRMIMSLQFNSGYINVDNRDNVVNEKAEIWYLRNKDKKEFPTDILFSNPIKIDAVSEKINISKPNVSLVAKKKFDIGGKQNLNRKFQINEELNYTISNKNFGDFDFSFDEELNSQNKSNEISTSLVISKKGKRDIFNHIGWGDKVSEENKIEQGGILLGQVYKDAQLNIQYGIVKKAIHSGSSNGNQVYLEMNHEAWSNMLDQADLYIDGNPDENLQVIGWYHTHPNHLEVFMSDTDVNTQKNYFRQPWHYAIVLNPQKEIWGAFVGPEANECKGQIVQSSDKDSQLVPREIGSSQKPPIFNKNKMILMGIGLLVCLLSILLLTLFGNGKSKPNEAVITEIGSVNKYYIITDCQDSLKIRSDFKNINQLIHLEKFHLAVDTSNFKQKDSSYYEVYKNVYVLLDSVIYSSLGEFTNPLTLGYNQVKQNSSFYTWEIKGKLINE